VGADYREESGADCRGVGAKNRGGLQRGERGAAAMDGGRLQRGARSGADCREESGARLP
jgi:hypothetical protein